MGFAVMLTLFFMVAKCSDVCRVLRRCVPALLETHEGRHSGHFDPVSVSLLLIFE